MTRSDRVSTLEEAKAQFRKSWDAWKAWAELREDRTGDDEITANNSHGERGHV
jgi:hypothetical protein